MKKKLIMIILGLFISVPTLAVTNTPKQMVAEIIPLQKTDILLADQKIDLGFTEESILVNSTYSLINPGENNKKLKMGLPFLTKEESLTVWAGETEIETKYQPRAQRYFWEITLEPHQELTLNLDYRLPLTTDTQGFCSFGYSFPQNGFTLKEKAQFTLMVNFLNTHPGLIHSLTPGYQFKEDLLIWSFTDNREPLSIQINLKKEQQEWLQLLSPEEEQTIAILTAYEEYDKAISLLEKKQTEISKKEEKLALLHGQAYYYQKAANEKKALQLFNELINNEATYPRAYWEVGKSYDQHTGKLMNLLNQIQELKVHSLLQPWLKAKLPPEKVKPSPPEITIKYTTTNESRQGIILKSYLEDPDGDLSQITLNYQWEGETAQQIDFPLQPFQYDYDLVYFNPAPGPFKKLFYELTASDSAGHQVTTGKKETFYLNKNIESSAFILEGANLILGDYFPEEQNKVYKWFKSYLKMAKEAGFVPVEAKSPLFIFMGKEHDFYENYQGSLFVYYTASPFNPQETRIPVHRHFLSHWYGPGWHTLPLEELISLGDALLLNKGWQAQIFTYLQKKNHQQFAALLCEIGNGHDYTTALANTFHLTPLKANFLTIWYLIGNYILAILIIITFAWLGKNGHLTKLFKGLS